MKITVFGLGYVGCVSLGCLANNGHLVTGVDVSEYKVDLINAGKPTIVEKDIDVLIDKYWKSGSIRAVTDHASAVKSTDVAFICVGTPSLPTGQLSMNHVLETAEQIGKGLKDKESFYTIVIRSTVIPGTNEKVGDIIELTSGKKRNIHFDVVSNPEFLREGSAVNDYYNPSVTVIGTENQNSYDLLLDIYCKIKTPVIKTDIKVAEMIKYVNNSFHALKITFANEVGIIAKTLGVDSTELLEIFALDDKLNISPAYLKSGMGYGGSCLPKDLKGLCAIAYDNYLETPLLKSIHESNTIHNNRAFGMVEKFQSRKVGIIGLAFKKGTDDLRNSPAVELAEKLMGKGYDLKIYDKNVELSKLLGTNKSYIEEKLPHISAMLLPSIEDVLVKCQTIVLVHKLDEVLKFKDILTHRNLVDLAGYKEFREFSNYSGIAW